jgi:hypothetical protein
MKKLINLLIALVFSIHLFGQNWQHFIQSPFQGTGGSASYGVRFLDDTLYATSVFVEGESPYGNRAVFTKIDFETGLVIDHLVLGSDSSIHSYFNVPGDGFNQLYEMSDNTFYLPYLELDDDQTENLDNWLVKITPSLEVIEQWPLLGYETDILCNFDGTRVDDDGNIFAYGSRSQIGQYFTADEANTLLTKISPQGEQLWLARYDNSFTIRSILLHSNDNIYISAGKVSQSSSNNSWLIKADANGDEVWRYNFGGFGTSYNSYTIEHPSGDILIVNNWNTDSPANMDESYHKKFQIRRIHDDGDTFSIVDDRKYGFSTTNLAPFGIDYSSDNGYFSWGTHRFVDDFDTITQTGAVPATKAFLFKLNENLDSVWMRHYWQYSDNPGQFYHEYRFSDVAEIPNNGGYVGVGWGRQMVFGQGIREDAWICKLDEYGCLEPGCQFVGTEDILVGLENTMTVFPNPVGDIATISFGKENLSQISGLLSKGELVIFDINGKEIYRTNTRSVTTEGQLQINTQSWPSGIYLAQLISGNKWLDGVRIVRE